MSATSKIEWTNCTWNPVTGCSKISEGCAHCYAERMAYRLQAMGSPNYADGFSVRCHAHMLDRPLGWKSPRRIFVNSMSDLFHPDVPTAFIQRVFAVMCKAHWHTFQVLTKRSARMAALSPRLPWPDNVWAGVTVESHRYRHRVDNMRRTAAKTRFLSLEPLLTPIEHLDLAGISWVIVGGESGPGARPLRKEWVIDLRDQCVAAGVPFFFKQWGGVQKKKRGRLLQGRTWDEYPVAAS